MTGQTEQALKNLGAVLKASGSDYDRVVKTTVLLADMADFAEVNQVYGTVTLCRVPCLMQHHPLNQITTESIKACLQSCMHMGLDSQDHLQQW